MRLASAIAFSATAIVTVALASGTAEAQQRRYYQQDRSERITIIDENGRARTRITVRPRSYLDGGTNVFPGERKFSDYAFPPTYMNGSGFANFDPTQQNRAPLPLQGWLPGYNPWMPF